ncbi:MAG: arginine--tRNA ligase, partial [Hyphomicrobiales bacterium]|nr:arginine--tRNA ligase [Hyphomicrobiales bacterium]
MNVFADFHARIAKLLAGFAAAGRLPDGLDMGRFVVEPPRDAALGDLAVNAAMVFAKEAKGSFGNPRALAAEIAFALADDKDVETAEVAGPGFINIRLKKDVYLDVLKSIIRSGKEFGAAPEGRAGGRQKINVEYVSANPTGPMHVGHGRGAVFGDALASLLEFAGNEVTREYYINDAGAQVDVLARSAYL